MKIRIDGDRVLHHGGFSNDMPIGRMGAELTAVALKEFEVEHNHGLKVLQELDQLRNCITLEEYAAFFRKLHTMHEQYRYDMLVARRTAKDVEHVSHDG